MENNTEVVLQELKEQIATLLEKQSSQYTDLMLLLKQIEERLVNDTKDPRSEDELFDEAKDLVIQMQKVSTSFLQRALGIGYSRAASLVDRLESAGIVGKPKGSKPREVLVKS